MIDAHDAMLVVAKKLPEQGVTFREFITMSCALTGDGNETIEETIRVAELEGIMADDIVMIGELGTRLQ